MSVWLKRCSALVAGATTMVLAAGPAIAAEEVDGAEKRPRGEAAAAQQFALLPDLAITHRLAEGGMNLWRMPLSDLEQPATGKPELVQKLDFGGFSYDRSTTLTGDFGDLTPGDDGTADHIIWHAQPDGGVLVWGVGGGTDTTPRLLHDLKTGGWSFANSVPLAGDVTGDGYDDLVVVHANRSAAKPHGYNVWVFANNRSGGLGAADLWFEGDLHFDEGNRWLLGDLGGDLQADLIRVRPPGPGSRTSSGLAIDYYPNHFGSYFHWPETVQWLGHEGGWSYTGSRQVVGDVNGDGIDEVLSIHAQGGNPGLLVWKHGNEEATKPTVWQDLRTGGWSFAGSRQHLADTDGDFIDDLISVHAQGANPGELVWRHISTGVGLRPPQVVADLKTGGWNYKASRESVATLLGVMF